MTGGNFVLHYDADDNGTASINSYTVAVCDGQTACAWKGRGICRWWYRRVNSI